MSELLKSLQLEKEGIERLINDVENKEFLRRMPEIAYKVVNDSCISGFLDYEGKLRAKSPEPGVYASLLTSKIGYTVNLSFGGTNPPERMKKFIKKHNLKVSFEPVRTMINYKLKEVEKLADLIEYLGDDNE